MKTLTVWTLIISHYPINISGLRTYVQENYQLVKGASLSGNTHLLPHYYLLRQLLQPVMSHLSDI